MGASRSRTVTVKLQVATLRTLEAVQFTRVVPFGKAEAEPIWVPPAMQTTTGVGRPEAATDSVTDAEHWPGSLSTTRGPGQEVNAGSGAASMLKLRISRTGLLIGSYSRRAFCAVELMPKDFTVRVFPSALTSSVE